MTRITDFASIKVAGIALLLVLSALLYWPGLSGPFLLDDRLNLHPLGVFGPIESLRDLARYVLDGSTSLLGRPLTLLTFAANAQDWPADPWWFKATGVGLHLLNGLLVFGLARVLAGYTRVTAQTATLVALAAAALWLLHPIQVSAVLYVSQRMTVLAATFTLAALLAYLHGRRLDVARPVAGLWWRSLAIALGGPLAVLSKETGALLPLFVLVLEATLLHPRQGVERPRHWQWWSWLFLWLPVLAMVLFLGRGLLQAAGNSDGWLVWPDNLLTQPRVLFDYLRFVFLPFLDTPSLHRDDFVVSSGLLTPVTTVAAMAGLVMLLIAGWTLRKRQPVLAFGVLWFLAGHSLESTVVGLDAVYEYRNYMPLLGPCFALSWYLCRWAPTRPGVPGALLAAALVAGLGAQTVSAAVLWGDEGALARAWAAQNPASPQAQLMLARVLVEEKKADQAVALLEEARARLPDNIAIALALTRLRCGTGEVTRESLRRLFRAAQEGQYSHGLPRSIRRLEAYVRAGRCAPLGYDAMIALLRALGDNPAFDRRHPQHLLNYRRAVLLSELGRTEEAVIAADRALAARSDPTVAYNAARWLLQAGEPDRARGYLERARTAALPDDWVQRWFGSREVQASDERAFDALEARISEARGGQG